VLFIFKTFFGQKTINTNYEVSYLAGYSNDGKTIYIDKRLPRYMTLKDGRKYDVFPPLITHESWERALERGDAGLPPEHKRAFQKWLDARHLKKANGYCYPFAHELATGKEREIVEGDGVDWDEYQDYMLDEVKKLKDFSEAPPDLDTKPEEDTHDYYRLHKLEDLKKKSEGFLTKVRNKYDLKN
jgi:hypothetical protein